jgi:mRNA-degrading endonuclease YafQ of YafQ-DinJ toxin-antitoxin module
MIYQLIYPDSYLKRVKKFISKHPEILGQYSKVLALLEINPFHPSLRLHSLKGKYQGLSSVSIYMSYRIALNFIIKDKKIILVDIGTHDNVY